MTEIIQSLIELIHNCDRRIDKHPDHSSIEYVRAAKRSHEKQLFNYWLECRLVSDKQFRKRVEHYTFKLTMREDMREILKVRFR